MPGRLKRPLLVSLVLPLPGCSVQSGSVLNPAGPIASAQKDLLFDASSLMLLVVAPVFVLCALIVWRYRAGNAKAKYEPNWENSRPLEIAIWVVPLAVVVAIGTLVWTGTHQLDPYRAIDPAQRPLIVQAVGLDWQWLFIYPDEGIASTNRLVFPAGRPLTIQLTSDTVLNALEIPALGGQIYAMAGMETQLNLMADAPATFVGRNFQFSGSGFPNQSFPAVATTADEFAAFVADARRKGGSLDAGAYTALTQPVEKGAEQLYGRVEQGLFAKIIGKYHAGHPPPRMHP